MTAQSPGVPVMPYRRAPRSVTRIGSCKLTACETPLWSCSGATTQTSWASSRAISSSTARPGASMPSSLVSRTRSSTLSPPRWRPGRGVPPLFGFFWGTLELDDVAVGVGDIERGAIALRTVAPPDLADRDAVPPQMRRERREVEVGDPHREVVEVACGRRFRRLWCRGGRDQIDHRRARAQLHELGLFETALDMTTQHFPVEFDRTIEIGDPQYEVVEPGDPDRASLRSFCPLQIPYVRHFRLLSPAIIHLTAIRVGRQADYCGGGWSDRDPAPRGCWLRQARLSAGSRTPSWSASIRSNCAPARRAARSSARWMYCSRVRLPERDGAGFAAVTLGWAAC